MIKEITKEKVEQFSGEANFKKVNDKEFHWKRKYSTVIKRIEGNSEKYFVQSDKLLANSGRIIIPDDERLTGQEYANENTRDFIPDFDYEADDDLEN